MKKALLIIASLVGLGIIIIYLSPKRRKISHVNNQFRLVKSGMTRPQVENILSKPDTVLHLTDGANSPYSALRYNLDFWHTPIEARAYLEYDIYNDTLAGGALYTGKSEEILP